MKRKWLWVPIILVLVIAIGLWTWTNSKAGVFSHVRRNLDKLGRYVEICLENPNDTVNYNGWDAKFRPHYGVVTFQISYGGFGSQTDEKGFYYASNGQPRTFGCDLGQEQREQQILFLGEGDNYVLTEQISPNWFWYEQHW